MVPNDTPGRIAQDAARRTSGWALSSLSVDAPVGSEVVLHNETGELAGIARSSDAVPPSVALVYKGRWPSGDAREGNVNALNPGLGTDLGESTAVHGVEAALRAGS